MSDPPLPPSRTPVQRLVIRWGVKKEEEEEAGKKTQLGPSARVRRLFSLALSTPEKNTAGLEGRRTTPILPCLSLSARTRSVQPFAPIALSEELGQTHLRSCRGFAKH